jgi:hypothetical protein
VTIEITVPEKVNAELEFGGTVKKLESGITEIIL